MRRPLQQIAGMRLIAGISEDDLRILLMVAAHEARECPHESPDQIARSILAASTEEACK